MSVKLCVLGDSAVGKTALLMRIKYDTFPRTTPTVFDNLTLDFEKGNQKIVLNLWDTAGQEKFRSLIPMYYANADIIMFCFSKDNFQSFESVRNYWYEEVQHRTEKEVKCIYVLTKSDLEVNDDTVKAAEEYCKSNKTQLFITSASTRNGVSELYEYIQELSFEVINKKEKPKTEPTLVAADPSKKEGCCK